MSWLKPRTLFPTRIEARRRNAQESTRPCTARGRVPFCKNGWWGVGRWRVTAPGAKVPPLPSTRSGQARNQAGCSWHESGGEPIRCLARRFHIWKMPVEPTMSMKTQRLKGNSEPMPESYLIQSSPDLVSWEIINDTATDTNGLDSYTINFITC